MSTRHRAIFLELLRTELMETVLPVTTDDTARRMTAIAGQQLLRQLIDETETPQYHEAARSAYRNLLPALRSHVGTDLFHRFEKALDIALSDWDTLEEVLSDVMAALLSGNAAAQLLGGKMVAIDACIRTEREQAVKRRSQGGTDGEIKPEPLGLDDEQQARLLAFLKLRFPCEKSLRIAAVKPLFGGFSKLTLFVDLADNVELPDNLVMRRDSPHLSVSSSVVMEYPLLKALFAADVRVPQPFAVDETGEVVGTPFILVARAPGRNIGDFINCEPNREAALDLARCLATLHAAPIGDMENVLPGGKRSLHDFMVSQIDHYEDMWRKVTQQRAGIMSAAFAWLRSNIGLVEGRRTIVYRDVGFHNLLVHENRVSVLLDWEAAIIGNPAEDVGLLYFVMPQMTTWAEFVATYEEAAGVKLDPRQLDYFIIFAMVRNAASVLMVSDAVFAGERSNLQLFYLGACFGDIILQRIASKLADAMGESV